MTNRLPPNFNGNWYVDSYPDVAMSGMSPEDHFLLFGRLMGREPAPPARTASAPSVAKVEDRENRPRPDEAKASPIVDRPEGFDPADSVPAEAVTEVATEARVDLDTLASTLPGPGAEQQALVGYARLLSLNPPGGEDGGKTPVSCGSEAVEAGAVRIARAWYADRSTLRLMIDCGAGPKFGRGRWSVRGYQAGPSAPGDLGMLGNGVQLPAEGPAFLDLALTHPLMPILLQLSDADSLTRAFALLPFPSLLPGGLHYAELKASQSEFEPMADFWRTSDMLLREAVGEDGWPERSVGGLHLGRSSGGGDGDLPEGMADWLDALFSIAVDGGGSSRKGSGRGILEFPSGFVPTVGALVSRQLEAASGQSLAGPYLVADAQSYQPRWSVAPPGDEASVAGSAMPVLRRGGDSGYAPAPIHLAIGLRPPVDASDVLPEVTTAQSRPDHEPAATSIVLDAQDAERTGALLMVMSPILTNVESELFVRFETEDEAPRAMLDRHLGSDGWRKLPAGSGLADAASEARNERVLSISDRIQIKGIKPVEELFALLERAAEAGSASCALLAEKQIRRNAVLQPASAGLFPGRVSFVSGPRLSFAEPDVLQALPDSDYAVVANTLHFTAWRRSALAALPRTAGPVPESAADIRIGLDLMAAGFRNWCTTRTAVRLAGPYVPRDVIDPLGSAYLRPGRWEDIFGRVTAVRELF